MNRRTRTIKRPSRTGSLTLEDARASVFVIGRGAGKKKSLATFKKAKKPSGPLVAVVGSSAMPRTEVTRRIWGYIKRNGLLEKSKSGRMVHADKKLKSVFGGKSNVSMYEMTKLVGKHLK